MLALANFHKIGGTNIKMLFQLQKAPNKVEISGRWHEGQVIASK